MITVDLVIITIIVLFTTFGFYWGAIRQLLAVTGLLASIVVASRFAPSVADSLHGMIADDAVATKEAVKVYEEVIAVEAVAAFCANTA